MIAEGMDPNNNASARPSRGDGAGGSARERALLTIPEPQLSAKTWAITVNTVKAQSVAQDLVQMVKEWLDKAEEEDMRLCGTHMAKRNHKKIAFAMRYSREQMPLVADVTEAALSESRDCNSAFVSLNAARERLREPSHGSVRKSRGPL